MWAENVDGEKVMEFADSFEQKIAKTWLKKGVEKLVTYEPHGHRQHSD